MKVAVVRNRNNDGVVCRFGQPCPEVYGKKTIQMAMDAIRAGGHTVAVFEGDKRLIANLERFMPPDPVTGLPGGIVLNMSYGIQGDCRYSHVPGMLELAGIPYTGSSPLGHALALDKVVTKILMLDAEVPTPAYRVMNGPGRDAGTLRYPLIVKPRHESTSYGLRLVRTPEELETAVLRVVAEFQQDALVEEYIDGREACVGILGNDPVELFPIVEVDFEGRQLQTLTWEDKYHKSADEPKKICPADLSPNMAARLRELSLATFRACRCKDYARVDIRIDPDGNPFVLEINSMASLGPGGSFVLGAKTAGYGYESLLARILDAAHRRYFGTPAMPDAPAAKRPVAETPSARPEVLPPHQVTRFYAEQILRSGFAEQLRPIVEPSAAELDGDGELDTSGERDHTRVNGLQHKYPSTALLLVTDQCFSYCRFCFRKRLVGTSSDELVNDYGQVADYIREHPEITDILLSGGDPFMLTVEQLHGILDHLLPIPHVTTIRFGTKGLVYDPARFLDNGLAKLFRRIGRAGKTPVLVIHVDHVGEISDETRRATAALGALGVQLFNQTVLLKAVNDDPDILAATFELLHHLGVRPYYLFQARPVRGALHFQVPLDHGVKIVGQVNRRLSGLVKTYRYMMSHYTGKVEILDLDQDNRLYMRYYQTRDPGKAGKVFSRAFHPGACWLDDLPCESEITQC